ncbi:hypothetical protein E4U21_001923 [Claviceps maximensis]|nr:hypothetical protein E4U21_001923 [Claviceps maximensis]
MASTLDAVAATVASIVGLTGAAAVAGRVLMLVAEMKTVARVMAVAGVVAVARREAQVVVAEA